VITSTRTGDGRWPAPVRRVRAGVLEVACHQTGPSDGDLVLLLHGFPCDIHSYIDVASTLAADG